MINFHDRLIAPRFSRQNAVDPALSGVAKRHYDDVRRKLAGQTYEALPRCCAICGAEEFEVLAERDRYNLPIRTAICCGCGLIQTNPNIRPQDYEDFYRNHYRELYLEELVGSPRRFFVEERWRGQQIASFVLKHVPIPRGSLVLEVGCGAGGILSIFRDRGFRTVGTDFGAANVEYGLSQGLDLYVGSLKQLTINEKPSLIIYSHVLEHIADLQSEIGRIRSMVAEDGYVYIEVPGVRDVHRNLFQGDFLRTFHIAHVYNFTLTTLRNLFISNGFRMLAGDETVRALFKPSHGRSEITSDYAGTIAYIVQTEKYRFVFSRLCRMRIRLRSIWHWVRSNGVRVLRSVGLYEQARRLYRHYTG